MNSRFLVLAALVVVTLAAPIASIAGAAAQTTQTANASTTTTTPTTTGTASTSTAPTSTAPMPTTETGPTKADVLRIVDSGRDVAPERVGDVLVWIYNHDLGRLSDGQADRLFRWLLHQAARGDVPESAIGPAAERIGPARAQEIAADVTAGLDSDRAQQVAEKLEATGAAWVDSLPSLQQSTTSVTTSGGGSTASAGNSTVVAQIDPSTKLLGFAFSDGEFVLTIRSEIPRRIVVSDQMASIKAVNERGNSMQVAQIPQKRITLDAGETTTIRLDVATWRGRAAITVATTGGAISVNNGVASPNPFGATTSTAGWFGGAITVLGMGGFALRKVRGEELEEPQPMGGD